MKDLTTSYLAGKIDGKLFGPEKTVQGIFTFLNKANSGDVVIRHWIDPVGVEMANDKGVSCIITQNPKDNAVEKAVELNIPIIITSKIEKANAFALEWSIENFAKDAESVVVTGTNGKSTTTHMIHTILILAGYNTYTNTDSKSEFNTLIDPVVSNQIYEFKKFSREKIDAMVFEVSEVQGWMDKLMKHHASLMTTAINPNVLVLTNISLDHIGLVNSIEETSNEIFETLKAFSKSNIGGYAIINSDDPLLLKMGETLSNGPNIIYYGSDVQNKIVPELNLRSEGIYLNNKLFLKTEQLPFKSKHFIQNTMAAIGACLALKIDSDTIKNGISSYKPLERRFSVLGTQPLIIDDFAHNPDGITATIKSALKMSESTLYIVFAIRGSRGDTINLMNSEAVVEGIADKNHVLVVTSSTEVVDNLNKVEASEKDAVLNVFRDNSMEYVFKEKLHDALEYTIQSASENDTILLIGAQGMDPASEILKSIIKTH
jgi:UDP-N-acetylmuramoyl-L-alanyl-D-glutamate--2,6-diaminopimelate ligase